MVPTASCAQLSLHPQFRAPGLCRTQGYPMLCPVERDTPSFLEPASLGRADWLEGRGWRPWTPASHGPGEVQGVSRPPHSSPTAGSLSVAPAVSHAGPGTEVTGQAPTSGSQDLQVSRVPGQCRVASGHSQGDVPVQELLQLLQEGLPLRTQPECQAQASPPYLPPGRTQPSPGATPLPTAQSQTDVQPTGSEPAGDHLQRGAGEGWVRHTPDGTTSR